MCGVVGRLMEEWGVVPRLKGLVQIELGASYLAIQERP